MKRASAEANDAEILADSRILRIVEEALAEDIGLGDVTTEAIVPDEARGKAVIRAKEEGILAGIGVAGIVFGEVDREIGMIPQCADGSPVQAGMTVALLEGPLAGILKAERTALNILQRMSGIATLTGLFVDAVEGTGARITDTRKTAPGLRLLDKLAVRMGGGVNHRFGLDDMVLIKDNHIAAAGGIAPALERCLAGIGTMRNPPKVEIETRTLDQVKEALAHRGVDRIMLDHFSLADMREAVRIIDGKVEVEASGNVTLRNVRAIAETGVDFICVGALTHSSRALDIALDVLTQSPARSA